MEHNLLYIPLAPIFIIFVQLYMEKKSGYVPPNEKDIVFSKINYTRFGQFIVSGASKIKSVCLFFITLISYIFIYTETIWWKVVAGIVLVPCIFLLTFVLHWKRFFKK